MFKHKTFRRLALFFSLILLLTSTVNTTFGFIVTKTDSLVNTFTVFDSVTNSLTITKEVEHPLGEEYVIPDSISFDFKVDLGRLWANTAMDTTGGKIVADENGSMTVSVKPGDSFTIEGIDAGTNVRVSELQEDGNAFSVKDGAAVKEVTVSSHGNAKAEFVNVYTPAGVQPVNVTVGGRKILEGRDWQNGDSFSFTLEQKTEAGTWRTLGTKTVSYDANNADFDQFDFSDFVQALTFDKVGTYSFRMTEVVGALEDVDYDKSINTFAVQVTDADMDGKLEIHTVTAAQNAQVTEKDGRYSVFVTFNNTFVPAVPEPDDLAVELAVLKTVKNVGEASIGPEGFEFVLENTASGEKRALESDESGRAVFALAFTASDIGKTYTYKLSETDEGMTDVVYDTKVYEIAISVDLDADNCLIASVTMDGEKTEKAVAQFENTYDAELSVSPPTGDRTRLLFWFGMMIASATSCAALVLLDRKYAKQKQ